jgi:glyoxylase-like metal-dependent hydrolase (beta-lactamase superfamily II)
MAQVKCFTFNMFAENTYILYDETKECVIIDPGCVNNNERSRLKKWLESEGLRPVRLLNTHCHLDHVFGNAFVAEEYKLGLEIHEGELPVLARYEISAKNYGIAGAEPCPAPSAFFDLEQPIKFGNTTLALRFVPGHSPASVCFYDAASRFVIAGDTLFEGSIGRTDLPGGNHKLLIDSINSQLFTLPDDVVVYSGHGEPTSIGRERRGNPFFKN